MMPTILIAGEDPVAGAFAAAGVQSGDYAVVLAATGAEALRLLDILSVDLLITDMFGPHLSGAEVIMAARTRYPALKMLALSEEGAVGARYSLHLAKVLGADATLQKPLTLDTFRETIEDLLSRLDDHGRPGPLGPTRSRRLNPASS